MAERIKYRFRVSIEIETEAPQALEIEGVRDAVVEAFEELIDFDASGLGPFGTGEDTTNPVRITDTVNVRAEVLG